MLGKTPTTGRRALLTLGMGICLQASSVALAQSTPLPPAPMNVLVPPPPTFDTPDEVTAAPLVPPAPAPAPELPLSQLESQQVDENWTIAITPANKKAPNPKSYESVYHSIPYRRAEYLANPSYRHDATMEFLFGQLRPTVINRTDNPQRVVNPRPALTQPYPISKGELYSYWPLLQYGSALPLLSPIP
ncbi:hypothetical protein [Planctomicrobium piriforme]|nr:hypothetical protein [Planctomicrobium piriforme]